MSSSLLSIALTLAGVAARAQSPAVIPAGDSVTVEQLESALEAVGAREDLDEATRGQVVGYLRDALAHLRSRQSAAATAAAYAAAVRTAPEETRRLRDRLDTRAPAPTAEDLDVDEDTPLASLEDRLTAQLVELAAAESRLAGLEAEAEAQAERPIGIRGRMTELRGARDELGGPTPPPREELRILTDARRLAAALEAEARSAELQSLEQELLSHGVRLELSRARRDDAARALAEARRRVDVLQEAVNTKRQGAAARARREAARAELAAADRHAVVRELAEENAELTRVLPTIATEIERTGAELAEVESRARQVERSLARALQQLDVGGVSQALGRLLVEERRQLPQVARHRAAMRQRRQALSDVGLAQMRIEEQRRELTLLGDRVEQAMARVRTDVSDEDELRSIREDVELLLQNRRDLLQQVSSTYSSYLDALNELDLAQQRLLEATASYERFLDRNLLWIPSAPPFNIEQLRGLAPAIAWLLAPGSWSETLGSLSRALRHDPLGSVAALLALGLALFAHRPLANRARALNARVGRPSADHAGLTLGALALAALRAAPLPLLLAVLAWTLRRGPSYADFTAAAATALAVAAPFLYNTLLLRILSAKDGVMGVHFRWSPWRLAVLRRQADRLTTLGVPLVFVTAFAYSSPLLAHRESLGRLGLMLLLGLVSGVLHALLHPSRGIAVPRSELETSPPGAARRLWHAIAVGAPLLLALVAGSGYTYTAMTLAGHFVDTLWLALALLLVRLVARRWLALTGRTMAREEREAQRARAVETDGGGERSAVASRPPDPVAVDRQTKRLFDAALGFVALVVAWAIWGEVVPALGVLDRTDLWSQTVTVDGAEAVVPVTLADLLLALLIAAVTAIAVRNLPGMTEVAFLRRRTLEPGSRYAINTLLRYVVVTGGAIAALNVLGWSWSQIQWLAAAFSVGLGFGLQEIVANFVSGLIILFERPVRVGDTVTVGQLTGTVSKVRIRATTITDWDRKEIIVPNKSFITEQVVNWTLSDQITRLVIPVGIAYGSDVERARRIMEDTLGSMPLVLDEPSPKVFFTGFGDSSLDFTLHVYSRQLADRLPLTHAVHEEILRALRQNEIEIPFPQRDLHLRTAAEEGEISQKTSSQPR